MHKNCGGCLLVEGKYSRVFSIPVPFDFSASVRGPHCFRAWHLTVRRIRRAECVFRGNSHKEYYCTVQQSLVFLSLPLCLSYKHRYVHINIRMQHGSFFVFSSVVLPYPFFFTLYSRYEKIRYFNRCPISYVSKLGWYISNGNDRVLSFK